MITRRQFVRASGVAAVGAWAAGRLSMPASAQPAGANGDIRVAVIGFNAHGKSHVRAYQRMQQQNRGVRLVALCDVDDRVLAGQAAELDREGIRVKTYRDMRELFDNPDIDAVSVATPNHWHALATVWACQAGKDVCVEKPVSHSIWEGRKMVEAARKHGRMVQADLDSRSRTSLNDVFDYVRSGQLGKIIYVRAHDYKRRGSLGKTIGPQKIPEYIDYNLWTGPAPLRPLMRRAFHYEWHWQWATGNGEIANNGSHQLDQVRWALGKSGPPRQVLSFGGRYGYVDDGEVPNTQVAVYDYDGIPVIYEARGLSASRTDPNMDAFVGETADGQPVREEHDSRGPHSGYAIFCEGGYLSHGRIYDNAGREIKQFERRQGRGAQENFIVGVRSRKTEDLKTDILEGHTSATFCHMGNMSYLSGEPKTFDEARAALESSEHATKALDRMIAHLQANGVDTGRESVIVGPQLTLDADRERFTGPGSDRANLFVKDTYREPFVIRDEV